MALLLMIEIIRCLNCKEPAVIPQGTMKFRCKKCLGLMIRFGSGEYCECSHHRNVHTRPDTKGCFLCRCDEFTKVKERKSDEYDEKLK